MFKTTQWEYSDDDSTLEETRYMTPGIKYLLIEDASYNPDNAEYRLKVCNAEDMQEKATLIYWLNGMDSNGNIIKNTQNRGTLHTLGTALAGVDIGIPAPSDVVGGVVKADVKLGKPNDKGIQYPRVYKFEPVPEDIALTYAMVEQYFE